MLNKRLVLGERDFAVFNSLHLHGALNIRQLVPMCFGEVSSETVRKRLRKLHQAGYIDATAADDKEEKGRPEYLYFLSSLGSKELANHQNISVQSMANGLPNVNHKEHLARLVDLHLAWQRTANKLKITEYTFLTKRVASCFRDSAEYSNMAKANADVVITFKFDNFPLQSILLILETGNLRQTRHWEPKISAFLKTDMLVLVVALDIKRLNTLKEWTLPMLKANNVPEKGRVIFKVYEDLVEAGFHFLVEYCFEQYPVVAQQPITMFVG